MAGISRRLPVAALIYLETSRIAVNGIEWFFGGAALLAFGCTIRTASGYDE